MKSIVPFSDNPAHVDNLKSIALLEAQNFQGADACLAVSLFEQNFVWRELPDEFLFVYPNPNKAGFFDRCSFEKNLDVLREFDWADFSMICVFVGDINLDQWLSRPLPQKIKDLASYYGEENVFATSYWDGFKVEEN